MAKGNKPQDQEPNISQDPVAWKRVAKMFIESAANDFGRHGMEVPFVSVGLDALESFFGPALVGMGITTLGGFIQNPEIVKRFVRSLGGDAYVLDVMDEAIDDLFEGLKREYKGRKVLTDSMLVSANDSAVAKLSERLEARKAFEDAVEDLDDVRSEQVEELMKKMEQKDSELVRFYRPKLDKARRLIRLVKRAGDDLNPDKAFDHLRYIYGRPPPKTTPQTVAKGFLAALNRLDAGIQKALPPRTEADPMVRALMERAHDKRRGRNY